MKNLQSYKILVFGAGSVGGYFGGKLFAAGFDVTLVARGAHLLSIKENGLTISRQSGEKETYNIKAESEPREKYDIIIITVKSGDTEDAVIKCSPLLADGGAVVSMQNGAGNLAILTETFPEDNVVGGVVNSAISVSAPGVITYQGTPRVVFGGLSSGGNQRAQILVEIFQKACLQADYTDNVLEVIWRKLLWNIAFNPLSALLKATCGKLLESEDTRLLMYQMCRETVAVANSKGINLTEADVVRAMSDNDIYETYKTSALQDVYAGKKPEIEGLMGAVVHSGLDTRVSDTVYNLCNYKFNSWFHVFPGLSSDVMVIDGDNILLIDRKNPPYGWALPGGLVDYGETMERCAVRELQEETGICVSEKELTLLGIYSNPSRDPRGHMVTAVYFINGTFDAIAGDDAADAKYFNISSLPGLAFDHKEIIQDFIKKYR